MKFTEISPLIFGLFRYCLLTFHYNEITSSIYILQILRLIFALMACNRIYLLVSYLSITQTHLFTETIFHLQCPEVGSINAPLEKSECTIITGPGIFHVLNWQKDIFKARISFFCHFSIFYAVNKKLIVFHFFHKEVHSLVSWHFSGEPKSYW